MSENPYKDTTEGIIFESSEMSKSFNSFERLISKLRHDLEKSDWDYVVSDEYSGKLPAYALYFLVNKIKDRNEQPRIKLIHTDPKNPDSLQAVNQRVENGSKVLVVTEFMETGVGMVPLIESLKTKDVDINLASLDARHHETYYANTLKGVNLFIGDLKLNSPFFNNKWVALVDDDGPSPTIVKDRDAWDYAKKVRRDVKKLADFFYEKYFADVALPQP